MTAEPYCVYTRSRSDVRTQRRTYAALVSDLPGTKPHITCFTEDVATSQIQPSTEVETAERQEREIGSEADPVVFVDSLITDEDGELTPDVLAIQNNGRISSLSGDLHSLNWTSEVSRLLKDHCSLGEWQLNNIRFAQVSSVVDATTGLFLDRADVLARLQPINHRESQSLRSNAVLFILARLSYSGSERNILVASVVRARSQNQIPPVQFLTSWEIPPLTSVGSKAQFGLDSKTGTFQQLSDGSLQTFQIHEPIPKLTSTLAQSSDSFTSFLRISSSNTLLASKTNLSLWNVNFESLQSVQTTNTGEQESKSKKRKRVSSEVQLGEFRLLAFYEELDLVTALSGHSIVAFQITASNTSAKRQRIATGRLIDAFDKSTSNIHKTLPVAQQLEQVSLKDPSTFEQIFFESLQSPDVFETFQQLSARAGLGERPFEMLFDAELSVNVKQYTDFDAVEMRRTALYILGRTIEWFRRSKSGIVVPVYPSSILIKKLPARILSWLIINGQFTPTNIETALRMGSELHLKTRKVGYKDVVNALAAFDPSLVLLSGFFAQSSHLDLVGTVSALKILIRSFDTPRFVDDSRLITYTTAGQIPNGIAADTDGDLNNEIEVAERAATQDIAIASSLLEDGLQIRANALRNALERLATCYDGPAITTALHEHMTEHDLTLLIELLRIELTQGGWTSRCLDVYSVGTTPIARNDAIAAISTLLNSAIDALGTSGWLAGANVTGDNEGAQTLVSALRMETSLVLEGVQESTFFSGFLGDFFRYEKVLRAAKQNSRLAKGQVAKDPHINVPQAQIVGGLLPLGVKTSRISDTRVLAGGEIKPRSARDTGAKLSQRLGKYTFETIRV